MSTDDLGLRISELISLLERVREVRGDLPVEVEGCDCSGAAMGVQVWKGQCEIVRVVYPVDERFEILSDPDGR